MKSKKQRIFEKRCKIRNKKLLKEYPFLSSGYHNSSIRKSSLDNYQYTKLDDLPNGWRIAFGKDLLIDIKKELIKRGILYKYHIFQIKEKYGGLRWYDNYNLSCLQKYEDLSYKTCIECGKPATKISTGWICPWCDDCAKKFSDTLIPIDEFYKKE